MVRIASGGRFPIDDAAYAIEFPDRVHICQKVIPSWKPVQDLDLQVPLRVVNANAVAFPKPPQEMHPLMHPAVPRFPLFVFEPGITVCAPFGKEFRTGIFTSEESAQSIFKRT